MPTDTLAMIDETVCEALGLPKLTANQISKLRRRGEFPPYTMIAGRKMVLRSDLEAWLVAQRERTAETVARRSAQARKAVAARWSHDAHADDDKGTEEKDDRA